ncbi:MAG: ABC transporter permease [Burkholderiales bacterium]
MAARYAPTIARFTLLEAVRNRLVWVALAIVAAGLGLAAFLHQVAITESRQIEAAVLAAFLRFAGVFLVVAFVVTSMVREFSDKVLEVVLSHPVSRSSYLFGKFAGFSTAAFGLAAMFTAPLFLFAPPAPTLAWGFSLALELLVMTAVSLFCVLSLTNVVAALSAAAAFYILSRSMGAAQIIAAASAQSATWSDRVANGLLEMVAKLLPSLDQMTRTDWLVVAGPDWQTLASVAAQAGVYIALIVAASLFDFYRQNF